MEDDSEMTDGRLMSYGKEKIVLYRTYGTPLEGVRTIPESSFTGRSNTVFGMEVRVEVWGEEFLPMFTEGDNSKLIATDSMKNFVHHHLGEYDGATIEGFLYFVAVAFLDTYSHMEKVRVSADEMPFDESPVPDGEGGFEPSDLVFRVSDNEGGFGDVTVTRGEDGPDIGEHKSGVTDVELVKVKDNSFTGYVQDEYTTLPERENRTLYINLNIYWTYKDPEAALGADPQSYVPAEQVRDIAQVVFHELDVNSIQDLVYNIGLRALERFPQIDTITFESRNKTWIGVRNDDLEGDQKVLREPSRPTGFQQFSMDHSDLEGDE